MRHNAPYSPPSSSRTSDARAGSSRSTVPSSSGRQSVVRHIGLRPGEPAPPSLVRRSGRGNLFTSEDKQYIVDYCNWEIKRDPSQTRQAVFEKIAQKVCFVYGTHTVCPLHSCLLPVLNNELTSRSHHHSKYVLQAPHHSATTWDKQAGRDNRVAAIFKRRSRSKAQGSSTKTARPSDRHRGKNDEDSDSDVQIISDSDSTQDDDDQDASNHGPRYSEEEDKAIVNWIARYSEAEWDKMTMRERWEPVMEEVCNRLT